MYRSRRISTNGCRASTAAAVQPLYKVGVGDVHLDLSRLDPAVRSTVAVKVGVGSVRVIVPRNAPVTVNAHAKVGNIDVFDQHDDGRNAVVTTTPNAGLVLNARVGPGDIEVTRAR